jgi:RNase P/RNase MRP subunit p29
VEVKIGVRDIAGQVVLESEQTPEQVAAAVAAAVKDGSLLELADEKGRLVIVPGGLIGFVEIGPSNERRVGFGAL